MTFFTFSKLHLCFSLLIFLVNVKYLMAAVPGSFKAGSGTIGPFGTLHTLEMLSLWAQKDEELQEVLVRRHYARKEEIALIRKIRRKYEESTLAAIGKAGVPVDTKKQRGKFVASSALLSHFMTHRYAAVTDKLRRLRKCHFYKFTEEKLKEVLVNVTSPNGNIATQWPTLNDVFMQQLGFISVADIYRYKPKDLYQGRRVDTNYGGRLSEPHFMRLTGIALLFCYFYMAIDWTALVLNQDHGRLYENEKFKGDMEFTKMLLYAAIQTHNRDFYNNPDVKDLSIHEELFNGLYTEILRPDSISKDLTPIMDARCQRHTGLQGNGNITYLNNSASDSNFISLCAGNELQPIELRSRMKCYLERKMHPYFILNPVKAEMLSDFPVLIHYYDFLGNDTIQQLLDTRRTQQPFVVLSGYRTVLHDKYRTSVIAKAPDDVDRKIRKISHALTGLMTTGSEPTWDVEYVPGRFYNKHSDALQSISSPHTLDDHFARSKNTSYDDLSFHDQTMYDDGDRLATVLFYVDQSPNMVGGLTPFVGVGVASLPVRGSAVFWLNLYQNGTVRQDMVHGACPVVHGRKIIFDQSIRYNVNFQKFKCSLNRYE